MEPASPNSVAQIEDDAKASQMFKQAKLRRDSSVSKSPLKEGKAAFTIQPKEVKKPKRKVMLNKSVTEIDDELDEEEDFETDVHLIDQIHNNDVKDIAKKCREVVKHTMKSHFKMHSKKRLLSLVEEIQAIRTGNFDLQEDSDEANVEEEEVEQKQQAKKMSGRCDIRQPPSNV